MEYKNKENRGALFPAKDRKSPKSPNCMGNINVEGKEYFLAGWTKISKDGVKYLKLTINLKKDEEIIN